MRVALYARVSTKDKGQDPEMQLAPLRVWASLNLPGWASLNLSPTSGEEFIDHASAGEGKSIRRAEWTRLLNLARSGAINLILVWKLDRAFRSLPEMVQTLLELQKKGVGFISITQGIDTRSSNPTSTLLLNILGSFAQFEHDLIAERVREGMKRSKEQGKELGRRKRIFDIDEAESMLLVGRSKREVAKVLGVGVATLDRRLKTRMVAK